MQLYFFGFLTSLDVTFAAWRRASCHSKASFQIMHGFSNNILSWKLLINNDCDVKEKNASFFTMQSTSVIKEARSSAVISLYDGLCLKQIKRYELETSQYSWKYNLEKTHHFQIMMISLEKALQELIEN